MIAFILAYGLPILFLVVMIESFGVPLPGETALVAYAVLASQGHYHIAAIIGVAAAGAIIGDNLGYWLIGRVGGRRLFSRWVWLQRYSDTVLPKAEKLMARHGGKTVFFGRFITILRYTAAWVAGLAKMPWGKFLLFNALGGIAWATLMGLLAYFVGAAAAHAVSHYGLYAAAVIVLLGIGGLLLHRNAGEWLERKLF